MFRLHSRVIMIPLAAVALFTAVGMVYGCSDLPVQPLGKGSGSAQGPGAVGAPCTPTPEGDSLFSGFDLGPDFIETGFAACASKICLANHFQGRVSCPLGQPAPTRCDGPDDTTTCGGARCVESADAPIVCDPGSDDQGAAMCAAFGGNCDPDRSRCVCAIDADCPGGLHCDASAGMCKVHVCETPAGCQSADASDTENAGKSCCLPGTSTPVAEAVCEQCDADSKHDAENAVYCSCRCGPPTSAPDDYVAKYCTCPDDMECAEIRPWVGLGDIDVTGKYCVKKTNPPGAPLLCGSVTNQYKPQCAGASGL